MKTNVAKTKPKAKTLKIRVSEHNSEKAIVNISVPLSLVNLFFKIAPASTFDKLKGYGLDKEKLREMFSNVADLEPQKLVDIEVDKGNPKVEVSIE